VAVAGVLLCSLALALPASAKSGGPLNEDDQIVLTGRLDVAPDETVDSAVIFNGPARIDGTVRDSVFVLNGDAEISGTVHEDVVVINGDVTVRSSAEIDGDLATKSTPTVEEGATIRGERRNIVTRFDVEGIGFAGRVAWWIGYSVSMLILGLLLLAFAPGLAEGVRTAVRGRTGRSIGMGVGLFFLIPIGAIVLLVSIVGIPLGFFVLLALGLIYSIGYVVATIAVGTLVVKPTQSRFIVLVVGWAILRVLALIPVLGGLVWFAGSVWGLGLLAVASRGRRVEPAPPPPPPVPVPA
jgi:cytoskeletal protein CcmA (bactofilin family)